MPARLLHGTLTKKGSRRLHRLDGLLRGSCLGLRSAALAGTESCCFRFRRSGEDADVLPLRRFGATRGTAVDASSGDTIPELAVCFVEAVQDGLELRVGRFHIETLPRSVTGDVSDLAE